MRFVAGKLNGKYLIDIHEHAIVECDSVKIAVAYASGNPRILSDCWRKQIKLTFWCRYDWSCPVTLPILKEFLDRASPIYSCKLVPDIFHPKVIWWEGYGAYVGSANMTENAWSGNIEAGLFLTQSELIEQGLDGALSDFFWQIDTHAYPLTREIWDDLNLLERAKGELESVRLAAQRSFNLKRRIPRKNHLTFVTKSANYERRSNDFLLEWDGTLEILRGIATRVSQERYRPSWVNPEVPTGVQADQFLHAYYYSHVRSGHEARHWQLHEENRLTSEDALVRAMEWWHSLSEPPHSEDRTIYEWAPRIRELTHQSAIIGLSTNDFVDLCYRIHALRDHALRVRHTAFGSPVPLPKMKQDERIRVLAEWLYGQRSKGGHGILESICFVLWGGPLTDVPRRIFRACEDSEWRIPHFGISTYGELVGWAHSDTFPPRNGRTSKALVALGYDVRIHSS